MAPNIRYGVKEKKKWRESKLLFTINKNITTLLLWIKQRCCLYILKEKLTHTRFQNSIGTPLLFTDTKFYCRINLYIFTA